MKILKFGGTSLGNVDRMHDVARLVQIAAQEGPVVVVASAVAGVTDQIHNLIEDAVTSDSLWQQGYELIEKRHYEILKDFRAEPQVCAEKAIRIRLGELKECLAETAKRELCPPELRDRIMAAGERLSVPLLVAALESIGCAARVVDGSSIVVTDDHFGEARVDLGATRRSCHAFFDGLGDQVPVVTGFVGADEKGRTTTLGRGGSDLSAAVLGAGLDAEQVEIWTDVDGVLTAPPRLVQSALCIPWLSYEEAAELSYFGAKVLHRRTVQPLTDGQIPIRVRNTLDPSRSGTEISFAENPAKRVAAVSAVEDVKVLGLRARNGTSAGFACHVSPGLLFDIPEEVLLECRASSDGGVKLAVPANRAESLIERLSEAAEITVDADGPLSVLAIVGHGIGSQPWVVGRALEALGRKGLAVRAVSAGASPHTVVMLVERDQVDAALQTVHDALMLDREAILAERKPIQRRYKENRHAPASTNCDSGRNRDRRPEARSPAA